MTILNTYEVEVEYELECEFEAILSHDFAYADDTIEVKDNFRTTNLVIPGGHLLITLDAESEEEAESLSEQYMRDGLEFEDNDIAIVYTAIVYRVSVSLIKEGMTLEKAIEILKAFIVSSCISYTPVMDETERAALEFLVRYVEEGQ